MPAVLHILERKRMKLLKLTGLVLRGMGMAAILSALPAAAGPKYSAPKVSVEIVPAPAALVQFVEKVRTTATAEASEAQLEALFSNKTAVLAGGVGIDGLRLNEIRTFDSKSPKILQAAQAMEEGETPPGYKLADHARDNVWRFLAGGVDRKLVVGPQPGNKARLCWGPVSTVEEAVMRRAEQQAQEASGNFHVTISAVKIYAKDNVKSAVLDTLPAKIAARVTKRGNGGMWQVLAPSGKTGFADQGGFVDLYSYGMCFGQQKDGSWLIDAIMNRTD